MNVNLLADEIAEELRLDDVATADAHAGLPASDAQEMGGNESAVMAKARDAGLKEVNRLNQHRQSTDDASKECQGRLDGLRASREQFVATKPPEEGGLQISRIRRILRKN